MCRFVAYLGPPLSLEALVLSPPHSLLRQSWAPRHQTRGVVNADGFGCGWYDRAVRDEPALYRTDRPLWSDRSFASLAGLVSSGAVLAAVRSATPPLPVEQTNTPPFAAGRWLFAHNGAVEGWLEGTRAVLLRSLSERRLAAIEGASDSEVLFALALDQLDSGASMGEALGSVVDRVRRAGPARLNLVVTDGGAIAATSWGESLFTRDGGDDAVVASEPFDDDPRWRPVPEGWLVETTATTISCTPLRGAR